MDGDKEVDIINILYIYIYIYSVGVYEVYNIYIYIMNPTSNAFNESARKDRNLLMLVEY